MIYRSTNPPYPSPLPKGQKGNPPRLLHGCASLKTALGLCEARSSNRATSLFSGSRCHNDASCVIHMWSRAQPERERGQAQRRRQRDRTDRRIFEL